ncbi:MAG: GAF domain-containing sensor histidine kinase [Chloroflexaceae bacterium]
MQQNRFKRQALMTRVPDPAYLAPWLQRRILIALLVALVYSGILFANSLQLTQPPQVTFTLAFPTPDMPRVAWLLAGGELWDRGVRVGDQVLALNQRPPTIAAPGVWRGTHAMFRIQDDQVITVTATGLYGSTRRWPLLLLSPWFLLLGTLVFFRAPDPRVGRATYLLLLSSALALASVPATIVNSPLWVGVNVLTVDLFAVFFARFCLIFPHPRGDPRVRTLLLLPMLLLSLAGVLSVYPWPMVHEAVSTTRMGLFSGYILLGVGALLQALFTSNREARRGVLIVGLGFALAITPFVLLVTLPLVLNNTYLISPEYGILPLGILPLSLAFAILRYRVFALPLLQRWLVHTLPWLLLLLLYLWVLQVKQPLLADLHPILANLLLAALLLLLGGLGSRWLIPRLHLSLDRSLFQDAYDYHTVLRTLSHDLAGITDFRQFATSLPQTLGRLMNLRFVLLCSYDPTGLQTWGSSGDYPPELPALLQTTLPTLSAAPQECYLLGRRVLLVPLRTHNTVVGHLCLGPKTTDELFRRADRDLLTTLSGQLGAILHTNQLIAELRAQVGQLDALNTQIQHAREAERARIAADLHDEPLQTALNLHRHLAQPRPDQPPGAAAASLCNTLITQLRQTCTGMHPPALEDLGLAGALDGLALECTRHSRVPVLLTIDPDLAEQTLPADLELVLYRATQEATNNALRHAHPHSIHIRLRQAGAMVQLAVIDDGCGFAVPSSFFEYVRQGHLGLAGVQERVQRAGGRFHLVSHIQMGTTLQIELPLEPEEE